MNSQDAFTSAAVNNPAQRTSLARGAHQLKQPSRAWRVVKFLSHAAIGGAIGGHLLVIGLALNQIIIGSRSWGSGLLLILLPFYMIAGALLALVSAALTLILENLIEEKLTMLPRAIATSIFSILILLGLASLDVQVDSLLIKQLLLPGLALGFPVGIMMTTRLRLSHLFIFGAHSPELVTSGLRENPISVAVGMIGGLALRLVGVIGFLIAVVALPVFWTNLEIDARLVMVYSIYYFGCTSFVSMCVRSRLQATAAALFINGLLVLLALYWEPSGGASNPLPVASFVLILLWTLFISSFGWLSPKKKLPLLQPAQ
ncbi:MAG TPA: hypothetical protein VN643_12815 [Pyrinomonadaceae bacterium]|nr:hypothetical protein [Pyrinomonadaceae bacterium]